jgi:hypothetical protein
VARFSVHTLHTNFRRARVSVFCHEPRTLMILYMTRYIAYAQNAPRAARAYTRRVRRTPTSQRSVARCTSAYVASTSPGAMPTSVLLARCPSSASSTHV